MDGECAAIEAAGKRKAHRLRSTETADTELLISDQNGRTGHRKTDTDSYSQDFNEDRHANFHFVH